MKTTTIAIACILLVSSCESEIDATDHSVNNENSSTSEGSLTNKEKEEC